MCLWGWVRCVCFKEIRPKHLACHRLISESSVRLFARCEIETAWKK